MAVHMCEVLVTFGMRRLFSSSNGLFMLLMYAAPCCNGFGDPICCCMLGLPGAQEVTTAVRMLPPPPPPAPSPTVLIRGTSLSCSTHPPCEAPGDPCHPDTTRLRHGPWGFTSL